jgi:hypothetical protein
MIGGVPSFREPTPSVCGIPSRTADEAEPHGKERSGKGFLHALLQIVGQPASNLVSYGNNVESRNLQFPPSQIFPQGFLRTQRCISSPRSLSWPSSRLPPLPTMDLPSPLTATTDVRIAQARSVNTRAVRIDIML